SLNPFKLARCAFTQLQGVFSCLKLIRETKPDAVIGFGGFTSAGVVLAARLKGVPVALHEANRVPGRAIRTLGRLARRVYLPPGVRLDSASAESIRHVGLPVRREIARVAPEAARSMFGFDPRQRLLVVFGGSQGATVLNEWV